MCFPAPGPMNPNVAKQPSPLSSMSIQSRSAILAGLNFTQELSSISFIDIAMYPLASSLNLQLKCMLLRTLSCIILEIPQNIWNFPIRPSFCNLSMEKSLITEKFQYHLNGAIIFSKPII